MRRGKAVVFALVVIASVYGAYRFVGRYQYENRVLKQVVARLSADSRVAEILVTGVNYDQAQGRNYTTIKFVEYTSTQEPLPAKYFTFSGNIIQFQSLVIRFDDIHIRSADLLKGKSAYLFWKVFMLDGEHTREYEISPIGAVPAGYEVFGKADPFETALWKKFWEYALNERSARMVGIKNAQIEAPGTMFVPGRLYTIRIEHDGGLRIDSSPIPPILRGEQVL